jgi:DNA-binding HxlR family transcriptional regulator
MQENNETYSDKCPLRTAMDMIGGKWKIPVLWQLNIHETMRFGQLKKEIHGITNTMLSNTLQELMQDDLIVRKQYDEMPLRVEYSLTPTGQSLFPILSQITQWGEKQKEKQSQKEPDIR